jgi:hypothetical protein
VIPFLIILSLVSGAEVIDLRVGKTDSTVFVDIISNQIPENYKTFTLTEPERIIVDLPGFTYSLKEHKKVVNMDPLLRIRIGEKEWKGKRGTRIVLDLTERSPFEIKELGETLRVSIKLKAPLRSDIYFYRSRAKRDPFEPLVSEEEEMDTLLSLGNAELVGIIQEGEERVALVKDARGRGFILRKGDKVKGGSVYEITDDSVVFLLVDYGIKRKVVLKMKRETSRRAK